MNLLFRVSPAEQIPAKEGSVQIVSASQACHWFDLPQFFKETKRVLCSNGIVALSGYTFPKFIHPTREQDFQRAFDLVLDLIIYGSLIVLDYNLSFLFWK